MIRRKTLQQNAAGVFRPAGAARHLMEKLHGALRRAQITAGKAEISIHDANQREVGKMPALGDDLRADDQINLALFNRLRRCCCRSRAGERIGCHDQAARFGE